MARPADQLPDACLYCRGPARDNQTYAHAEGCTWRVGMADELAYRYQEIERLHLTGRQRQVLLFRGIYPEGAR